ncbi:GntR family transcriptional regulator [Sphingobacterium alkalisoli]|uniref:GntR family transcriptional regulator n=1 Tax=Sphingobacterium alkalisoli TaxID=1874115 RepID=A0A4U0GRD3_9SPHI|nr:GntR family transcriptional regulator [Sphingobacterium alkalisoli]TJY61463.1 GntR family transcriptional regulator [Sphingobacterium alkalisoli]GGH30251.1 methycitrate-responsive transcriptional regulator of methylisocitrate utilization PrpR [Sphingobacterium alkalisoli]
MKEDSLAYKVYLEVRKKILSNQLVGGARLVESNWADKLSVSRVAVREAFMRLAGENLVEFGEKGGCFVKGMTIGDIQDIRELRELLEVGALKILFEKKNLAVIAELELICDDFSDMVAKGYYGGACEADVRFHEKIIESTENQRLIVIYKNSNIPLFHMKLGAAMSHMEDYADTDREHRKIVEALKENNWKIAFDMLTKHLNRGAQAALELV